MDRIFVMKDGRISEQGNYQELLSAGGEFSEFLVQYLSEDKEENGSTEEVESLKQTLELVMGKEKLQRQLSKAISIKSQKTKTTGGLSQSTSKKLVSLLPVALAFMAFTLIPFYCVKIDSLVYVPKYFKNAQKYFKLFFVRKTLTFLVISEHLGTKSKIS